MMFPTLWTLHRNGASGPLTGAGAASLLQHGMLADVRCGSKNGSVRARVARPSYPQEQTSSACPGKSVWCQEETHALQQTASLCLVRHRDFTRHLLAPSIDPQQHDNDGAHQRATREQ
jgi:hypothetical protein